ncbi:MAG: DHH family phosphoesterase [Methanosphaera sp.]|uniref:single-stranded-DNA-specific exonuclease RecJ n=1 Tax=Methanosphaera sp. TaxID=2666342 RepID=UPI0025DF3D2E|nr:DHH family phosphoesterase [Methanosphaera sp.]MCI5867301.1 DHH family phosphoesterase [Methanosphaera sp.]MDD6534631.1 DHH family phosphoesterase [Methanosphaera sp.]MDY3955701.1 DHH family phosphoesterase [Methanosphaera sp.]
MNILSNDSTEYINATSQMNMLFKKAKDKLLDAENVTVYTHTDCDGITAGSILTTVLDRLEIDYDIEFREINTVESIRCDSEIALFSDLGSGQDISNVVSNSNQTVIILDHHPSIRKVGYQLDCGATLIEINPCNYGLDGSYTVSGGGLSYLFAREFGYNDLSWMGILSAIGDVQNTRNNGKLCEVNREILSDAASIGAVDYDNDLILYGRQTRPLFVALSYFNDVKLPFTGDKNEAIYFLNDLGIPVQDDFGCNRNLCDLTFDEKGVLFRKLTSMLSRTVPSKYTVHVPKLLMGEYYEFPNEPFHTTFRDASEYSSAVNACGRNKKYHLGMMAIKDRISVMGELDDVTKAHKRYIAQTMGSFNSGARDVEILDNIQFFDGGDIRANVVGTICGMLIGQYDWQKPMVAYTHTDDENPSYKVSLRCSKLLSYVDNTHYGNIVSKVAQKCGGSGGGHSVACGAYIPEDNIEKFISLLNDTVKVI